MTDVTCPTCKGERWVCEDHPDVPWNGDQECCRGAGMPCPACNASNDRSKPPAMPPGFVTIHSASDGDGTFEGEPVKGTA